MTSTPFLRRIALLLLFIISSIVILNRFRQATALNIAFHSMGDAFLSPATIEVENPPFSNQVSAVTNQRRQGQAHLVQGEYARVHGMIDSLPDNAPEREMLIVLLGNAYLEAGNYTEAVALWKQDKVLLHLTNLALQTYEVDPQKAVLALEAVSGIVDAPDTMTNNEKRLVNNALGRLARVREENRDYQGVIDAYMMQLTLYPDISAIHRRIGRTYRLTEQYSEAQEWLDKARELDSEDASVYYELGRLTAAQQMWQLTIEWQQQAIQYNADFFQAYYELGNAYEQLQQLSSARQAYETAIKLSDGKTIEYRLALAMVCEQIDCIEVAIEQYRQVLEQEPSNKTAREHLENLQSQ